MASARHGVDEARDELMRAEAFGRQPAAWAVEAVRDTDGMTVDEALDVVSAARFGRKLTRTGEAVTPVAVQCAERVLSKPSAGTASESLTARAAAAVSELVPLIESRMGMSRERAALHVRGEVLRLQEVTGSTKEWVTTKLLEEVARRKAQRPVGGR